MARQQYTLAQAHIDKLSDACNPKAYLIAGAVGSFDVQARCAVIWAEIGAVLHFNPATVQPVQGVFIISAEAL